MIARAFIIAFFLSAIYFALTPLSLLWLSGEVFSGRELLLLLLNLLAWTCLAITFWYYLRMQSVLKGWIESLGVNVATWHVPEMFEQFAEEFRRVDEASFACFAHPTKSAREIGMSMERIANLAIDLLDAQSVEISLFDGNSGLWSQALLVGNPHSILSQSMLLDADRFGRATEFSAQRENGVIVKPLHFAGTLFGALRIECPYRENRKHSDERLAALLAVQTVLLLIDARLSDEILRMRRVSEESLQAKTGFLANLSHEIRGPLGIILNGVELNLEGICGPLTDQQRETLRMIKDGGNHLLDLVNDVLDYAKVESGKVTAKPVVIQVNPLLKDLSSVIRSQAESKKHTVKVEPCDETIGIRADRRHIRQILINLLTNAVKYTPEGGNIKLAADVLSGERVKISVSDSGVGIPEDQRSKVFGAFERVEHSYSSAQTGTGLGMPLARKLAEVNGGTIDFQSEVGKGSTFYLILPRAEVATVEKSPEEQSDTAPIEGRGDVVMIVDPDLAARDLLASYLRELGFVVETAQTSEDVISKLRSTHIRLAIVENDLTDGTGEELVGIIRSGFHHRHVPVIMLSAKAFVFDIERFLKLGVDRCLTKPVELREVANTARRLIDEVSNSVSQQSATQL